MVLFAWSYRFSHLSRTPTCDREKDRRTDRRTHDDSIYRASIASRGKMNYNSSGTCGMLLNVKFELDQYIVSPLGGKKRKTANFVKFWTLGSCSHSFTDDGQILERKLYAGRVACCPPSESHWVRAACVLKVRKKMGRTDGRTSGRQTETLRFPNPIDAASVTNGRK